MQLSELGLTHFTVDSEHLAAVTMSAIQSLTAIRIQIIVVQ